MTTPNPYAQIHDLTAQGLVVSWKHDQAGPIVCVRASLSPDYYIRDVVSYESSTLEGALCGLLWAIEALVRGEAA